ncbi:cytochrome P450 2J5-like [Babylonia areolata]|uniref:cytochrome P450 2J5-like n=1 Tax=Babylonia areolata TaxID=304850 RepID=UPI003FD30411
MSLSVFTIVPPSSLRRAAPRRQDVERLEKVINKAASVLGRVHVSWFAGIISTSGPKWKEQRKTSLEILRAIGMGKNVLAEKIQEEITHYIQAIKDHQGAPAELHRLTLMSVSNISCNILFGRRFRYHDPDFSRYLDLQDQTSQLIGNSAPLNFFPFLQYLPGDLFHVKRVAENTLTIQKFIREQVQQHTENYHASAEPRDFIHAYLRQVYKRQEQGDTVTSLDETNLIHSCFDLYAGGTETVTTTIAWALLFLLHHPHVQQKCHREIRDTLGPRPILSITDKAAMPYVEATVMEIQRKANVVPLGLLHGLARDVNFRGYVIPQDAAVMPGLEMVLNDPDIWSDPENFRPERFIGADGEVTRKGEFMPFCVGRRMCPGESLARMELFLYLATLIQHFRFLPPEEGQLPSLEGIMGLTHILKPFKVRAEIRK